jgi:hypothetical protein
MTIYAHMTPEEAIALATRLMADAQRVNEAKKRGIYTAYQYVSVGYATENGKKDAGDKIRVRIGDEKL